MHIQWIPLKWLVLMTVWYFNLIICDMPVSLDVSHVSLCSVWFESAASRPTGVIMGRFTCWPLTTWRQRSAFNRPYPSSKHIYRGQQTQMTQTRFLNACFDSFFCCVRCSLLMCGVLSEMNGRYEDAETFFERATCVQPNNVVAWALFGENRLYST